MHELQQPTFCVSQGRKWYSHCAQGIHYAHTIELKFIGAWMRILWTFLLASGMQQKVRMQIFV
jgi:hypothetical protein